MLSDVNELSTIELVRNMENWIGSNQGIIVQNIHLSIDANCPVVIENFSDMECSQPQPTVPVDPLVTVFPDTQSLTPAIAGAAGAVTVVALVVIVFVVLVAKKHKKRKRNIHVSRDSKKKTR